MVLPATSAETRLAFAATSSGVCNQTALAPVARLAVLTTEPKPAVGEESREMSDAGVHAARSIAPDRTSERLRGAVIGHLLVPDHH
jgi:hypothetical protein